MEELNLAKVVKIVSPSEFWIQDAKGQSTLKLQLRIDQNKCFTHLLPALYNEEVAYEIEKGKSNKIR